MSSQIEVSICIVNWNARDYISRCLASIDTTVPPISYEVIVVDNASTDGSQDLVIQKFPKVTYVQNKENVGFATANNQAIERAKGDWIFLLNPDTELLPGCLDVLLSELKKSSGVAVAAPKLLNTDGSLQRSVRRFPNFKTALYRYTFLKKCGILSHAESSNKMDDFSFEEKCSVEQPAGAALLIRRNVLDEVGWLDPSFFLFYEEVDLCRRIKKAGYEIYFYPQATLIHHSGKSRQKNRQQLFLPTLKSMFYYFGKHYGAGKTHLFKWLFKPLLVISAVLDVVEERVASWLYRVRGDDYRAQRKKEKSQLKASFLKNDLFKFLFEC